MSDKFVVGYGKILKYEDLYHLDNENVFFGDKWKFAFLKDKYIECITDILEKDVVNGRYFIGKNITGLSRNSLKNIDTEYINDKIETFCRVYNIKNNKPVGIVVK